MSERLDLAEAALSEAMGERLDGLRQPVVRSVARQILAAADRAGPRADLTEPPKVFRVYAECGNWKVATAVPAEGEAGYTFTVPRLAKIGTVGVTGLREYAADAFPCVTRDMVTGQTGASPAFHGDNLVVNYCALCGAAISALGPEGAAVAAIEDYTERHRAWHDRLERLLETKG